MFGYLAWEQCNKTSEPEACWKIMIHSFLGRNYSLEEELRYNLRYHACSICVVCLVQDLRAHATIPRASLLDFVLLHVTQQTSDGDPAADDGGDHLLGITNSADAVLPVRNI